MGYLSPPRHWLLCDLRYHGFVDDSRCLVMSHVEDALSHSCPTGRRASDGTCSARMRRAWGGAVGVDRKEEEVEDGEEKESDSGYMLTFYQRDPVVGSIEWCEANRGVGL